MPKELAKMLVAFPKTLNHGIYNVHFYDGIDFPFNVGPERWRVIKGTGNISFDNAKNKISKFTFGVINHPISQASNSAILRFKLNGHELESDQIIIKPSERRIVEVPVKSEFLTEKNNQLSVEVDYGDPNIVKNSDQILGLMSFAINDTAVNLESLDFPYISQLGPKMTGIAYKNFGGSDTDPWTSWNIHTQIYERVPDFWWVKSWYYWDLPRTTISIFLFLNLLLVVIFGYLVFSSKFPKKLK